MIGCASANINYYNGEAPSGTHGGKANNPVISQISDITAPNKSQQVWNIHFDGSGGSYGSSDYQVASIYHSFGLPMLNITDIVTVSLSYKATTSYNSEYLISALYKNDWSASQSSVYVNTIRNDSNWHNVNCPIIVNASGANPKVMIMNIGWVSNACDIEINNISVTITPNNTSSAVLNTKRTIVCKVTRGHYNSPFPKLLNELLPNCKVVNSGTSGQTTEEMLKNFNTDVIAYYPDYCIILMGTNDVNITQTEINLNRAYDYCISNNILPIACTIPPKVNGNVEILNQWIVTNAASRHIPVVDVYAIFVNASNPSIPMDTYMSPDGIHPNDAGSSIMAKELVYAIFNESPRFYILNNNGTYPFTAHFLDYSFVSPVSRYWNFGDGVTSTEQNPVHRYQDEGKYTVTLTLNNSLGSNSIKQTLIVPPENFSHNKLDSNELLIWTLIILSNVAVLGVAFLLRSRR